MTFVTKATYRLIGNISVNTPIRGLFMIWYVSFFFFCKKVWSLFLTATFGYAGTSLQLKGSLLWRTGFPVLNFIFLN